MYQKTCIFHLILLGIPSSLVLSIKNMGWRRGEGGGGGLLNRQETRSVKHGESDLLTIPQGKDCSDIN